MCGIICYIGNRQAVPILIAGLKTLEYRGYDSVGICINSGKKLTLVKRAARISEFSQDPALTKISGTCGIGHTRWATHGEPNDENAHPHMDCTGDITIIHNGIIENHAALKGLLMKEGHVFKSKTDSEVLSHLVEKFYEKDLRIAVQKALKLVVGTFGVAVMHKDHDMIIIAKKGSPLVIGIGEGEMLAASDATALINHTKKVQYLNDDEIAILYKDNFIVENLDGEDLGKNIEEIKWSIDEVEKQGYKHFMLKEIMEQPSAIENTIKGRLKNNHVKLTLNIDVRSVKRIIIVACGTSWHSALIGKHLIEGLARIPVEVDYASEFRYRNPIIFDGDLVIAISQSGETADTLAAVKEAKSKGAKTIGIVNVVGSTISREVDSGIFLHAGPEIGVASTKAFTCQVTALLLFALYIRQELGLKLEERLINGIIQLPNKIQKILENSGKIRRIAEGFIDAKNFLFLGRDINFPVALEGALKLKEISYIHAEGYPAAEMKHGPIALIDNDMPVVFIATRNNLSEKILSNIQEVKARKGKLIIVMNDMDLAHSADHIISVPPVENELSPLVNIIPLQLLAYFIADLKGLDVDKPRNLAKSVTVE